MRHVLDDYTKSEYLSAVRTVATKIAQGDPLMLDKLINETRAE